MNGSRQQLALEAAVVGVGLIPMWMLVRRATTAMNIYGGKEIIDIALAGAAFHLLAEESGLNTWYLTNGYAAQKAFHDDITGETITREMNEFELAQWEADQAQTVKDAADKAKADLAKAAARQAVLDKLGLTANEVTALLG